MSVDDFKDNGFSRYLVLGSLGNNKGSFLMETSRSCDMSNIETCDYRVLSRLNIENAELSELFENGTLNASLIRDFLRDIRANFILGENEDVMHFLSVYRKQLDVFVEAGELNKAAYIASKIDILENLNGEYEFKKGDPEKGDRYYKIFGRGDGLIREWWVSDEKNDLRKFGFVGESIEDLLELIKKSANFEQHLVRLMDKQQNAVVENTGKARLGLALLPREESLLVHAVHVNSIADLVGVNVGDRLVQINGLAVSDYSSDQLRDVLPLVESFIVKRGDETIEFNLDDY
jgi:hypothetical protein